MNRLLEKEEEPKFVLFTPPPTEKELKNRLVLRQPHFGQTIFKSFSLKILNSVKLILQSEQWYSYNGITYSYSKNKKTKTFIHFLISTINKNSL